MFRTKSGANWRGTIYEYEKKTRNSCVICVNSKGGYCQIHKVDIESIGPSFYKYCSHYKSGIISNEKKAANTVKPMDSADSSKNTKKCSDPKPTRMTKNEAEKRQNKSVTIVDGRYIEKVSITKRSETHKACSKSINVMVLRRISDNSRITVKFVNFITEYTNSNNKLEVTRSSNLGRFLMKARLGSTAIVNGYRCMVEGIR